MSSTENVLITGGAGFLGSHVTDRCMREGYNVWVVDNLYTGIRSNFAHHEGNPRFHFIKHDVQFPFPLGIQEVKFDKIFHLACAASPVHYQNEPIETTLTCVNGTNNVLREALRCNCPVLIASTSEVYGDPAVHPQPETYVGQVSCTGIRSCYDEGKRCGEALCFDYHRKHGVKVRVARIFNTYGPRMLFNDGRIISNFVVQALEDRDITIYGTGEYTRSFQYCDDLVEGFFRLINHPTETGPVNLGNPEEYTIKDMAEMIKALVPGCKSKIVYMEAAKDDPKQRKPDITKAKAVLGWAPTIPVAEGLKRTKAEFESRLQRLRADQKKIYIQCNPLLDISAHVDEAFLKKYKLEKASAGLCTPDQAEIYAELESMKSVQFIPGGSGLNTARVAQWMAQAPAHSLVSYVGCIADDKYGQILKASAELEGVSMLCQYDTKECTGSCAVCVVGKERSLLANLAAANNLKISYLESDRVVEALKSSQIAYLSGFTLTLSAEHALFAAKYCQKEGRLFCMNLSAVFIVQFFGQQLDQLLPHCDIIFGNEDEAKALSEAKKFGTTDILEIAKKTAALPKGNSKPRMVVFTQGSQATVFAKSTGESGSFPVPKVENIIDTNGAGDAFVGGFLAGLSNGKDVKDCIHGGHYAAGVIIQHDGCTFPSSPPKF